MLCVLCALLQQLLHQGRLQFAAKHPGALLQCLERLWHHYTCLPWTVPAFVVHASFRPGSKSLTLWGSGSESRKSACGSMLPFMLNAGGHEKALMQTVVCWQKVSPGAVQVLC